MKNLIQIAGVIDKEEAKLLMELGVDYLGFPLRLPVNKEDLTEDEAVEVIKTITPPHQSVLITYLNKADEIISFCDKLNVKIVQLHGDISFDELVRTKTLRPDLEIIKSLVVASDNYDKLVKMVETFSPWVDAFITDTFDPVTGAEGATGKTHDWSISKKLVELSPKPVIIAGGLNPKNVKQAILEIKPAGVDVHTGVELPNGRKSAELVKVFVKEAKEGFALIESL
ncbi:MAG: N-(5'-phosphoribosyl)anthranilate isomerase [Stygiobacter sp. RIFOXYC12_FULL_38_8]|nr:MAG: N-(5'-phosphoribosyl)anthranilate isomerase [Stygiobacter sp. GWC2_38_9]OGU85001.1 MAG: N-(5'-phosphoribosyl)anthranilate isomerase [Stygiobacter sp. RIFOXYA12_FULL_38_9]OGV07758.1 MAG: N-(5'-phosphoribosyl)anthranilate isomerase [Stygiobacter sp. RIFOXYB2_FULL_37_11]OGV11623.1 MAG: N-(5'-phosphoribosyl)anthranilate isomerase [Stygiobacter sp. RIFOXYA2_FULL_38_8]OGV12761.1 MAG: N-(5'-phosphoribosyl)anthranilate isomerase [Stygiobacter sp. RIFOXYC2_FULL_38_25]OGV27018.1 MAG: N-(5'-phosp